MKNSGRGRFVVILTENKQVSEHKYSTEKARNIVYSAWKNQGKQVAKRND